MPKTSNLKSLMFMSVSEKNQTLTDGKDKRLGKLTRIPRTPLLIETEGYRIISDLFKQKDAKTIIDMGSAADVLMMSPLALASSIGHKQAVLCLLAAHADVNRQSPDGNFPLMQAVRAKFIEIVELLLKKEASVTMTNYDGDNSFMLAIVTGEAKIINMIWPYRSNLNINHENKFGATALHMATEKKWEGCVEFLLLNGADVNKTNANGRTPLFISVIAGDQKMSEKLVAKGTDILIEDNDGYSAICRGIEAQKEDIVNFLISKLTNTQKDAFAKSRIERLFTYTMDQLDCHMEDDTDVLLRVLFTVFQSKNFRDNLYRIKAIPNVLGTYRQFTELPEAMSIMFMLCSILMSDYGSTVDERFTLQFIRAQGQDLVMKTLKQNPDIELEKPMVDGEQTIIAGIMLPIVCLSGLDEGRDWLKKNLDNAYLIRLTDSLRTGPTIEIIFSCSKFPTPFKKVWASYLEFFDSVMIEKRIVSQVDLIKGEERERNKALKKRERKRQMRQRQKQAKEVNVNRNANRKGNSDGEVDKAVGAEKAKRADSGVCYDQPELMPNWNACIESVISNEGNTIHTKRDLRTFRYNYLEPSLGKRTTGYSMLQATEPFRVSKTDQIGWQKVENKKAAKQSVQVEDKQRKTKSERENISKRCLASKQTARVMGSVCWADIAKGASPSQQQQRQFPQEQQQHKQQQHQFHHQQQHEEWLKQQKLDEQFLYMQHQQQANMLNPRHEVSTYDEEFPTLRDDADRMSVCDTDVSDGQSVSTISVCGDEQIDHIPDPAAEYDAIDKVQFMQPTLDGVNYAYTNVSIDTKNQLHHQQQATPQYDAMSRLAMPNRASLCRYGPDCFPPPPGFETQPMEHMTDGMFPVTHKYAFHINSAHAPPPLPGPQSTIGSIAQSLLHPYSFQQKNPHELYHAENGSGQVQVDHEGEEMEPSLKGHVTVEQDHETVETWKVNYVRCNNQTVTPLAEIPDLERESAWNGCHQATYPTNTNSHCTINGTERSDTPEEQTPHEDMPLEEHNTSQEVPQIDYQSLLNSMAHYRVSLPESVLYPETLRGDDVSSRKSSTNVNLIHSQNVFPSFHDMRSSVFGNEILNPFLLENIAKEQVKRQYRTIIGKPMLEGSSYFHDFDYYASLYGLTSEQLRASAVDTSVLQSEKARADELLTAGAKGDDHTIKQEPLAPDGNNSEPVTSGGTRGDVNEHGKVADTQWPLQSRRWRDKLTQIVDLPYTMRKQLGKIVIPVNINDFKINKSGNTVVLGFLTDGSEVAVRELVAEREIVDKDLIKKLAASDTKYNFLLRYKALAEMGNKHYLATELCDYTLEEYISITRIDYSHDPLAANRLAWQLLKGIRYLHDDLGIVHGNLKPDNIYVDSDGKLRVGGYAIIQTDAYGRISRRATGKSYWQATEMFVEDDNTSPTYRSDVQVVGMLFYYILTGGRHPYGSNSFEIELNLCQNSTELAFISEEVNDLVSSMLFSVVEDRPSIDSCLRHPFFWSEEKKFRMVLIAGSDVLKEMKTGVALTGSGSTTMTDFLNVPEYQTMSDGWLSVVDLVVLKEMRSFRQYKNTLAEMVLFIYNCCLHFDKMSFALREVLDDPCRYFLTMFPPLFMAVYKAIKASDRTERTCYRPFF